MRGARIPEDVEDRPLLWCAVPRALDDGKESRVLIRGERSLTFATRCGEEVCIAKEETNE
jgi:hypothetical protein